MFVFVFPGVQDCTTLFHNPPVPVTAFHVITSMECIIVNLLQYDHKSCLFAGFLFVCILLFLIVCVSRMIFLRVSSMLLFVYLAFHLYCLFLFPVLFLFLQFHSFHSLFCFVFVCPGIFRFDSFFTFFQCTGSFPFDCLCFVFLSLFFPSFQMFF